MSSLTARQLNRALWVLRPAMYIVAIGALFWVLAALACFRLLRGECGGGFPGKRRAALWALALLGAALLMFRPHEDILGGQDQGAYVNSALTYLSRGTLAYTDRLLEMAPPETRPDFLYYGHDRIGVATKLHVLKLHDRSSAAMEPWFQPAYPLTMSGAAAVFGAKAVLYVAPFFAILTAIALWALARRLIAGTWAGAAAFVFYLLNAVIAWHGRCARAELPASFFVVAGLAFLVGAWKSRDDDGAVRADVLFGGACMGVAPFFHVTAWMVAGPAAALALLIAVARRPVFLTYAFLVAAGAVGFAMQTLFVADPYGLRGPMREWGVPLFVAAAALLLAASAVSFRRRARTVARREAEGIRAETPRALGVVVGGAVCLLVLAVYFVSGFAGSSFLNFSGFLARRLRMTDVRAFAEAVTLPSAALGLMGWFIFISRRGPTQIQRIAVAMVLLPGIMLVGEMPIRMYFLRRAAPFMAPAFAMALASLVCFVPTGRASAGRLAAGALAVFLAAWGPWCRPELYTCRDYRGLFESVAGCAAEIAAEKGILLCEYSRMAAPFDHMFGVPTLGLDNEHIMDYSRAEEAWERIMRSMPDTPAFFATPFPEKPASDRFLFRRVNAMKYNGERLAERRGGMPSGVIAFGIELQVYRMTLAGDTGVVTDASFPYSASIGCGNMGWRGFQRRVFTEPADGAGGGRFIAGLSTEKSAFLIPGLPEGRGRVSLLLMPAGDEPVAGLCLVDAAGGPLSAAAAICPEAGRWSWVSLDARESAMERGAVWAKIIPVPPPGAEDQDPGSGSSGAVWLRSVSVRD